ncbi:Hsp20/alpha crystallin family protein [Bacillus sp. FJAT-27251]|uniref:Hsp20/alpha crystallin family protein n=1 Tax=Bacillus sp. FJAT-27251 TaxID=1684142 RepID=UPI0006A7DF7F|nr:Hsp20/alpha crystallin family protein [Bacillus sp. FJAT-27251]
MEKKPDKPKQGGEPFGEWMKHFQHFFQEQPVRGVLQSIDDFFKQPFPYTSFPIDVRELKNEHIVTAELPGIKKEQISIDILGSNLTISVKHQDIYTEEDDANKVFRRSEHLQHSSRTIGLPFPIDEKKVKATYRDGLLKIMIPKLQGRKIDLID